MKLSMKNSHSRNSDLRGHLGVSDTVSGPLIVPLNYLVILHLIHLKVYITSPSQMENGQNYRFSWKMYRFKGIPSTWLQKLNASTGIGIVQLGPPDVPLKMLIFTGSLQQFWAISLHPHSIDFFRRYSIAIPDHLQPKTLRHWTFEAISESLLQKKREI